MPTLEELVSHPPQLPVTRALADIAAAARPGACAVVTAPPGTGKTTLLPPAVAVALAGHEASAGRVLVTQPRRVAARAAARRIARLLGEEVGGQVGYSVRGDSRVSGRTRVEMVTPGVALRRLQRDPELPGVAGIIIDEFHERDLDTDLALAFALDARAALREDLFIALTSATLEASRTVSWLRTSTSEEPALVDIPGDYHPLELRYAPPPRGVEAVGAIGNDRVGVRREFLAHVARTVEETVASTKGSLLVFLPGVGEIEAVRRALSLPGVDVLTLHGQLSGAEQDRALTPASGRRVILSTSIAESSLTVPGVSVVVDSGLAREPRFEAGRSLSSLVTVPASLARLEQ
ncbi:MAG: AAA family ATPase, partial [Actinomyces bouchesdurhonensis]|nr:AAA family ATPase [Actinomyces bouchesdurhonensis]